MSYPQLLNAAELRDRTREALQLPPIVVICGSTRFMEQMADADRELTASGYIVVKPGCDMKTPHPLWADPADAERIKTALDDLHRAKIRLADDVLVVGDYVGASTTAEIDYARELGKPVRFTHPEVDPDGTHEGYDIAGEPAIHQGPREWCWDPACEEPRRQADDE